jgi:hypothetical protein
VGDHIWGALGRFRLAIASVALTYVLTVIAGAVMVHAGNAFALEARDGIVDRAHTTDPASRALREGRPFEAGILDFAQNVLLGAIPTTVAGLAVALPYPFIAYRGWVGGIVSVDGTHSSRLADPAEARYYLLTLILQLVPYSLTGGAGVALGIAYLRRTPDESLLLGLPRLALNDTATIYAVALPLFFVASMWEFLAR